MIGDPINLRRERKRRERAAKEDEAAANRARHGLTGTERMRLVLERVRAERAIDGARREQPPE